MALTKLAFRPGINRETTAYANEGGWWDCNLIRFRAGKPESIGGWTRFTTSTFLGTCRSLFSWLALDGTVLASVGTNLKFYVVRGSGLNDITPIRETTAPGAVTFAATNGSPVITVTDSAHGALLGDFVTFSGAVGLGGNITATLLNAEHQITQVVDSNTYRITVGANATIRTNLVLRSQEFDTASWTKTRATVSANTTTAPDGSVTADSLIEDTTATSTHVVQQNMSWTAGVTYTFSIYVKALAGRNLRLTLPSAAFGVTGTAVIDTLTGAVSAVAGVLTATSEAVGAGWFRFSISSQATTTASSGVVAWLVNGATATYTGDGSSGVYLWGAQVEVGASATEYIPTTTSPVTVGDTGNGGASVVGAYQINTGLNTSIFGTGWGTGPWSRGTWGSGSSTAVPGAQLSVWSQDNFGEDLVFNVRDGGVYYWDRSLGFTVRGVPLSSLAGAQATPTVAKQVMISERDRHVIAFGCDPEATPGVQDPLTIRFSDQENAAEWRALPTTTAGELRLGTGTEVIVAVQTKQQIIVLTDVSVHAMQYLGDPFTFGVQEVSSNISTISPKCAVASGDAVFWMGKGEFYVYDGVVRQLDCDVKEYVFNDMNLQQNLKVHAGHNAAFSEIWWLYPSSGSTENDSYVVYNYAQNVWYYGRLSRTAWLDRDLLAFPIAAATDGYLYYHENGFDDGSANPPVALAPYIESSVVDLADGDQFMFATRVIPDLTFRNSTNASPTATLTIKARNFPGGAYFGSDSDPVTKTATIPVEQFTNQLFVRLRGRSMSLRIESNQLGTAWRLGDPRLDLRTDGRK